MVLDRKDFPKKKLSWLWENMEGGRAMFFLAILGTVVYSVMHLVVPYFSGRIVDLFLSGTDSDLDASTHMDLLIQLIIGMVGLTLLRVLIVYFDCMAYEYVSQHTLSRLRNKLYDKIQRQDMKFYNEFRTGDLMTRMTGDLDSIRHNVAWVIRVVIESIVLYSAAAIYYFFMNVKLALCVLAITPFIFIVVVLFRNAVGPKHALLREKLSNMNTDAQENIAGNRVVKAFAREEYEIEKFDEVNKDYKKTNVETAETWLKYFPYIETLADLLPVVLLLVGGIFMIKGELTMGEYVAFSGLTWAVANPMRNMGNIMNEFQRFSAASVKVMEIYYSEADIVDSENPVEINERLSGKIEFRDVSFKYDDGDLPVLHNVSFTANPGETIAIMGETGCGKTSLIQMIPRFYEPTNGEVLVDGVNVNQYRLEDLRKNIGLANQDVLLYSDTIDGNISYGAMDLSHKEITKYAKYSAAADFISKMPEGYDTIVGERGVGLSGGQKQRIALARALAIRPAILILDDTTSAVDVETEKHIQDSLRNLDFNCTKIIIAQRISTTKYADRILILKDGRIIEEGNHKELIEKNGYYASIVRLQEGVGA